MKNTSSISCLNCRRIHRKCNKELPKCSNCTERDCECVYQPRKKRASPTAQIVQCETSEQAKHSLLDGLVNRIFTDAVLNMPAIVPILKIDQKYHCKVMQAQWYAMWAVALALVPNTHFEDLNSLDDYLIQQFEFMDLSRCEPKLHDLATKYPRPELQDAADKMYEQAKEIVLHPDIFCHIASDVILANICSFLFLYAFFLGKVGESKLYFGAINVFRKQSKVVLDIEIETVPEAEREHFLKYQTMTLGIAIGLHGARAVLYIDEPESFSLEKLNLLVLSLLDSFVYSLRIRSKNDVLQEVVRSYQKTLKRKTRFDQVLGLFDALDIISRHMEYLVWMEDSRIWTVLVHGLQLKLAALVQRDYKDSPEVMNQMNMMKIQIANKITEFTQANLNVLVLVFQPASKIYAEVAQIHIDYATSLLANPNSQQFDLQLILNYLQADSTLLHRVIYNHASKELSDALSALQSIMPLLFSRILNGTRQSNPPVTESVDHFDVDDMMWFGE